MYVPQNLHRRLFSCLTLSAMLAILAIGADASAAAPPAKNAKRLLLDADQVKANVPIRLILTVRHPLAQRRARQLLHAVPVPVSEIRSETRLRRATLTAAVESKGAHSPKQLVDEFYRRQEQQARLNRRRLRSSGSDRNVPTRRLLSSLIRKLRHGRATINTIAWIGDKEDLVAVLRVLSRERIPGRATLKMSLRGRVADGLPRHARGRRTARSDPPGKADWRDYMPSEWKAETTLTDATYPVPVALPQPGDPVSPAPANHEKITTINIKWMTERSLSWYAGDDPKSRGFEAQAYPADKAQQWSRDWTGATNLEAWSSNLPDAYRDDLYGDQDGGGPSHFAVGTGDGTQLELDTDYFATYQTDRGDTDTGPVKVDGQATRHASLGAGSVSDDYLLSDELQRAAYCALFGFQIDNFGPFDSIGFLLPYFAGGDEACFFSAGFQPVEDIASNTKAVYALGSGQHQWSMTCPSGKDLVADEGLTGGGPPPFGIPRDEAPFCIGQGDLYYRKSCPEGAMNSPGHWKEDDPECLFPWRRRERQSRKVAR